MPTIFSINRQITHSIAPGRHRKFFHWLLTVCCLMSFADLAVPPLKVIRTTDAYLRSVKTDSSKKMTDLKKMIPNLQITLPYATPENFTGKRLYKNAATTYLRYPAAVALQKVATELQTKGLSLLVWDAYRPYRFTVKMWQLIRDERYVANPAKGSGHNRGLAIDLTLTDASSGQPLDMGTSFDHFSDTAHHSFRSLPAQVLANRRLLRSTMEKYGFIALETEWWHYSWPNQRNYEVLDLSFAQLQRISDASLPQ